MEITIGLGCDCEICMNGNGSTLLSVGVFTYCYEAVQIWQLREGVFAFDRRVSWIDMMDMHRSPYPLCVSLRLSAVCLGLT